MKYIITYTNSSGKTITRSFDSWTAAAAKAEKLDREIEKGRISGYMLTAV